MIQFWQEQQNQESGITSKNSTNVCLQTIKITIMPILCKKLKTIQLIIHSIAINSTNVKLKIILQSNSIMPNMSVVSLYEYEKVCEKIINLENSKLRIQGMG